MELKRSFRCPLVRFSYHLYNSVKNISRTVIIHSEKNQNKGPRRNFKDHPVGFSHLQMAKWSPREDGGLGHHLLYQLESYDPSLLTRQQSALLLASSVTSVHGAAHVDLSDPHITQLLLSLLLLLQLLRCCTPCFPSFPFSSPLSQLLLVNCHFAVIFLVQTSSLSGSFRL